MMRKLRLKPIQNRWVWGILALVVLSLGVVTAIATVGRVQTQSLSSSSTHSTTPQTTARRQLPPVVLVVGEKEKIFFTQVSVDVTDRTIAVSPALPTAQISAKEAERIYINEGIKGFCEKVYPAATDMIYAAFTFEDMRELLQYYGDGLEIVLNEPLEYTDAVGMTTGFPAGKRWLSANQVADLLRGLSAEDVEARRIVAELWVDFFKRYISGERDLLKDYSAFANCCDTNIRIYTMVEYVPLLEEIAEGDTWRVYLQTEKENVKN